MTGQELGRVHAEKAQDHSQKANRDGWGNSRGDKGVTPVLDSEGQQEVG